MGGYKSFSFLAESLRARLEKLRSERIQQEKFRDEVIKQLRHVHQRITQRRKESKSRGMSTNGKEFL